MGDPTRRPGDRPVDEMGTDVCDAAGRAVEIGFYAESSGAGTLGEALGRAAALGIERVELSTGGQAARPFLDVDRLLGSGGARAELLGALAGHGLRLSALNASAFPLHPRLGADHVALTRKTFRLAGLLGVDRVVVQSGAPGDGPEARLPNWIVFPWPEEAREAVRRQWDAAIALWTGLAEEARRDGVGRLCFEPHPGSLVSNVPTLLRLRSAVGEIVGANLDTAHLLWQGMDVPTCVQALGPALFHVHVKDVLIRPENVALVGMLDGRPDVTADERPWSFCTPGYGHDATWWRAFVVALRESGYDDVLSIEHNDPARPGFAGIERTVGLLRGVI